MVIKENGVKTLVNTYEVPVKSSTLFFNLLKSQNRGGGDRIWQLTHVCGSKCTCLVSARHNLRHD
jgi:hypothetical protein